ncbi:MAG TPA: hypothetical protein VGP07_13135 [Polyangia bacterium]
MSILCGPAFAVEGPLLTDDTWRISSTSRLTVDGGLALGAPAALPTGLSTGVGAGASFGSGWFTLGARGSWSSATESSIAWTVTHQDIRLRATGAIQHAVGRGRIALRMGLGHTFVREDRLRNQGARAGLTGSDLETSSFSARPAGDLEVVVLLHVAGPWLLTLGGGPSVSYATSTLHGGWISELGIGWQP